MTTEQLGRKLRRREASQGQGTGAGRAKLEELARRWMALHVRDREGTFDAEFDALHAADFVDRSPGGRDADRRAFAEGLRAWYCAFPDLEVSLEGLVIDVEAASVAVRWSARGTHRGRYLDTGPTGRPVRFRGIEVLRLERGRIAERWGEWDGIDLMSQLGRIA